MEVTEENVCCAVSQVKLFHVKFGAPLVGRERPPVCPCPSFSLHSYSICSTGTQVWRSGETIALPVWGLARTLPLCPENQTVIKKTQKKCHSSTSK